MALDISTLLPQSLRQSAAPPVQVKLSAPLPASLAGQPLTVQVVKALPTGEATLQLPGGAQIAATLSPPLNVGSTLNLAPPSSAAATLVLARALVAAPMPQAPGTAQPPPLQLPAPGQPQPAPQGPVTLGNLTQAFTAAVANSLKNAAAQAANPLSIAAPTTPSLLPPGPVQIQMPAAAPQLPLANYNIPLSATVVSPPNAQGQQTVQLTLPPPTPTQPPQTVQLAITAGTPLPPHTQLTLTLPLAPGSVPQPQPSTALLLSATPPAGTLPASLSEASLPAQPIPPTALAALKVVLAPPPGPSASTAAPQTAAQQFAARVLTPPAGQPPAQTLLLANGQQAVVQLPQGFTQQFPQGLPSGSIVVVDINPLAGGAGVTRLEPVGTQTGQTGQPQTQATGQPVATQTPQALLPPGSIINGTVTQQNPAQQQLTLTFTPPATAQNPNPQPQTLTLQAAQPLPLGTALTVRIDASSPTATRATILALQLPGGYTQSHALTTLATSWPTLNQAMSTLAQQSPHAAALLRGHLPQLGALVPTLMPYLDAVFRGNADRAFGRETVALLKALGVDLSPDMAQLQTLAQPHAATDPTAWRGMLFPYLETPSSDPRQGGFFWRRQKKGEDETHPSSTRFVVQLGLTQLGEVQLDGLLSYPDLWLKLRRKTASEPGFIDNLQKLVAQTLDEVGLTGGIAVETTQRFEVDPAAEILAASSATLATEA